MHIGGICTSPQNGKIAESLRHLIQPRPARPAVGDRALPARRCAARPHLEGFCITYDPRSRALPTQETSSRPTSCGVLLPARSTETDESIGALIPLHTMVPVRTWLHHWWRHRLAGGDPLVHDILVGEKPFRSRMR